MNARSTPLTPKLRKTISDVITGLDVPSADVSIGLQALEAVALELAMYTQARAFAHCGEGPLYLADEEDTTLTRALSRLTVRARAMVELADLLESTTEEEETESEAAE
jgi:hypothetical protein